jgi:hypothetical protein
MPVRDTTPEAKAVQVAAYRRMTPGERIERALELSDFLHELALSQIRVQHPGCSDAEANRVLTERLFRPRIRTK